MRIPWESFLARYSALAKNLAAGLSGSRDDAADIAQEAMLALLRAEREGGERFESMEHARNYFLRTVRNLALRSRARAARVEPLAELAPGSETRDGQDEAAVARLAALARALESLDLGSRALFDARLRERRTLAEISRDTGVPISTLHAREKALLERLRRAVDGEEPGA